MMEKRSGKLILHKFYQYLLPSIFLVVAMQIGSLANGIVIGQFIGEEALAAASLSVSFLYLIQLPALAIPPGLAIVLGNLFSKRKFLEATRAFNITFIFGLFLSLLFIPVGLLFIDQICVFLCGTFTDYIPYMKDYLLNYFLMAPLYFLGVMCVYVLSSDNKPKLSALFFVICTVVHIGLEIIFCICLPKENIMVWVAWSGGFGMVAGLVVLIPYILSKKRLLKFSFTKISLKDLTPVLKASLTTVFICLLTFAMSLTLMKTASMAFTDSKEMNTYVILTNMLFVVDLFVNSILQMFPTIVSALDGEKDYTGIFYIIKRVLLISFSIIAILILVTMIYPDLYLQIFGVDKSLASIDYQLTIRLFSISFLFYNGNRFIQAYYPGIFKNRPSLINIILQHGLFGIPLAVFLMISLQAKGYAIGVILAECLSFIATLLFILVFERKKAKTKSIFLLQESDKNKARFEMSVTSYEHVEEAKDIIKEKVIKFGGDMKCATIVALGAEELLLNTFEYGYKNDKRKKGIDILLSKEGKTVLLSIKDDGIAFDPTTYTSRDGPEGFLHGIPIIKSLASRLDYVRILNLNETIVEVNINEGV